MSVQSNRECEIETLESLVLMSASAIDATDAEASVFGFDGADDFHDPAGFAAAEEGKGENGFSISESSHSQFTLQIRGDGRMQFTAGSAGVRPISFAVQDGAQIDITNGRLNVGTQPAGAAHESTNPQLLTLVETISTTSPADKDLLSAETARQNSPPIGHNPVVEDSFTGLADDPVQFEDLQTPSKRFGNLPASQERAANQDQPNAPLPIEDARKYLDQPGDVDISKVGFATPAHSAPMADGSADLSSDRPHAQIEVSDTEAAEQMDRVPQNNSGNQEADPNPPVLRANDPSASSVSDGATRPTAQRSDAQSPDALLPPPPLPTASGTDGDDWLTGTDADDVIVARDGNDVIHAPVGNNFIDGGSGTDRLMIYDGRRSDFTIESAADGFLQLRGPGLNGGEITYSLINVEEVEFTDGVVPIRRLSNRHDTAPPHDASAGSEGVQNPDSEPPIHVPSARLNVVSEVAGDGIFAFHRSGQTFLTWQEDTSVAGEHYHVYRHSELITAANIDQATRLTEQWGPLDDDTSVHQLAGAGAPGYFVIEDLGRPLGDDTGLFVYTTQDVTGPVYYAVTTIINGVEDVAGLQATDAALSEHVTDAKAVLVDSQNGGRGLLFTQFMDYADWNPTFQGYAYNYAVALPSDYDASRSYGLKLDLHAHSESYRYLPEAEFGWESIQVLVDDPGADRGTTHTWWFGFAAEHDYQSDGDRPTSGTVRNFTQQRVLEAVDQVRAMFNVDDTRIHAQGNSMGASGALSLGVHYGDVFSGVVASQPMTNYAASPEFQNEFQQLWGSQTASLGVQLEGPYSDNIQQFSAGGSQAVSVWQWMNHQEMLHRRRGEPLAYLIFGHGKQDDIIDWQTQGQPFIAAVNAADAGHTALLQGDAGHTWMGFIGSELPALGGPDQSFGTWLQSSEVSYPSITNSSGSGPVNPGATGDDTYNLNVDWATDWNRFDDAILDTSDQYAITIRSLTDSLVADVTPRNTRNFRPAAGSEVRWTSLNAATGDVLNSGRAVTDSDGLVTITDVRLLNGAGTRLVLSS